MKNVLKIVIGLVLFTGLAVGSHHHSIRAQEASVQTEKNGASPSSLGAAILNNSERMLNKGEETFRFDTFGDEAFWGDTLQLHQAIEGAKLVE